ncbi:hypothetical protein BDA96_03G292000 [Sorghum bicolor]|jgi:hypothetical protein|uniref:Uncharacterized protein n=1 Tax=Sorghum bicolor TaxID=4558 RepID=A0A921UNU5_SORBI|nr:hypothetical protein BDA96_03G292000 [Sorghum bicolor]
MNLISLGRGRRVMKIYFSCTHIGSNFATNSLDYIFNIVDTCTYLIKEVCSHIPACRSINFEYSRTRNRKRPSLASLKDRRIIFQEKKLNSINNMQ